MIYQLCYNGVSNRASTEIRADSKNVVATAYDDEWLHVSVQYSSFDAYTGTGAVDEFDRIRYKVGDNGRIQFDAAGKVLLLTSFHISGLEK